MTIDEAIAHAREVAKDKRDYYEKRCTTRIRYRCKDCFYNPKCNEIAEEQDQIAEWLDEFKMLKQEKEQDIYERAYAEGRDKGYSCGEFNGYNKAIDDFAERLKQEYEPCKVEDNYIYQRVCSRIDEVAEQLKECKDGNSTTDN